MSPNAKSGVVATGIVIALFATAGVAVGIYVATSKDRTAVAAANATDAPGLMTQHSGPSAQLPTAAAQVTGTGGRINADGNLVEWWSPATEQEARRLATYLVEHRAFGSGDGKRVELRKAGRTYELHIAAKTGADRDEQFIGVCRSFSREASVILFGGSQVDIHICDDTMKTIRVVVAPPSPF